MSGDLEEYRRKRDLAPTPEPAPAEPAGPAPDAPRFVVQRHDARALHHDLRPEIGGALASWAVPKVAPHLAGRPLILKRSPNGVGRDLSLQHSLPDDAPDWLARVDPSRSGRPGAETNRCGMVHDAMGLLWVVDLGCIDLDPWQSRAGAADEPTQVLFDLDPNEGVPFAKVVEVAPMVREELDAVGLRGYPKTTGATGMQVFLPARPGLSFEAVRLVAQVVARRPIARRPERGPRVYLDANQNGRGRSISARTPSGRAPARRWRRRSSGTRWTRASIRAT